MKITWRLWIARFVLQDVKKCYLGYPRFYNAAYFIVILPGLDYLHLSVCIEPRVALQK